MPANKTYVVGLTGGIGCGKSEAAHYLAGLGAKHIDADAISRALTAEGGAAIPEIRKTFGDEVFDERGALNRRALADIVFGCRGADDADAQPQAHLWAKRALEGIIHPLVQREVMDEIAAASQAGIAVTVLDVPLLFETGMDVLCDEIWAMSVDPSIQLERVRTRDGLSDAQAEARVAGQMSMEERNSRATRVIETNRPIEKTRAELNWLYQQLLKRL